MKTTVKWIACAILIALGFGINPGLKGQTEIVSPVSPRYNPHKKLIEFGWYWPDATYVRDHIASLEQRPFDGIVFKTKWPQAFGVPAGILYPNLVPDQTIDFDVLSNINWGDKLTDNFLWFWISNPTAAWFNDAQWVNVRENAKLISKAVVAARVKGIFFDTECYVENLWTYTSALYPDYSFEQVQAKVRQRGKELMESLTAFKEDIVVLTTGLYVFSSYSSHWDINQLGGNYGLLKSFADGMLEGASPQSIIVDGNELAWGSATTYQWHNTDKYSWVDNPYGFVAPELLDKSWTNKQVGQSLYYSNYRPISTEVNQTRLEHTVYQALLQSDEYVWFYSEETSTWWTDPFPPLAEAAIRNAVNKYEQTVSLGYTIDDSYTKTYSTDLQIATPVQNQIFFVGQQIPITLQNPLNISNVLYRISFKGVPEKTDYPFNIDGLAEEAGTYTIYATSNNCTRQSNHVTFRVIDGPGTNSQLRSIAINGSNLEAFRPTTLTYTITLQAGSMVIPTVSAMTLDPASSVQITDPAALPGSATLVITAAGGASTTYIINFQVLKSSDASLSALTVNGSSVTNLRSDKLSYTLFLPEGTLGTPTVVAIPNSPNAVITVQHSNTIPGTATVTVVSEDGMITKSYAVSFTPILTMPYLETFNPPFPTASGMGSFYRGWTAPLTNAVYLEEYVTNAWISYDGSNDMKIRNRLVVNGVRQTTYLISPAIKVSGSNPSVSWLEAASTNAWTGPRNSPINLYITTTNPDDPATTWTQVMLPPLTTAGLPNALLGEPWQSRFYSLNEYQGQTIWWKWELVSTLQGNAWEYTYWCLENVRFCSADPDLRILEDTDYRYVVAGNPEEKVFTIVNNGLQDATITSLAMENPGSPFEIISPVLPVTLTGNGGSSGLPNITVTIRFAPVVSGPVNQNLLIGYNSQIKAIALKGNGLTCADAIQIPAQSGPGSTLDIPEALQGTFYRYTAATNELVTVTSCHPHQQLSGTEYAWDTYLEVYSSCPFVPENLMVYNDDMENACGYNRASSSATWVMLAGSTCYIYWPLLFPMSLHSDEPFTFTLNTALIPIPDAQFSADKTVIDVGQSVNFTSLSSGYASIWNWDFPGSVQGSVQVENPEGIVYPAGGVYYVKLNASNGYQSGERMKSQYIIVGPQETTPVYSETFTITGMKSSSVYPDGNWTFVDNTGTGRNWQVRTGGVSGCFTNEGPMPSTSGAGGYLVLPADEYNCINGVTSANQIDAFAQSPSFDCSGYDVIVFSFEERFRICCSMPQMELQVSNDGGASWTALDLYQGRSQNVVWGDPVIHERINISEVAANQPDVKVRFYWKGSSKYYWMIDDIEITGYQVCKDFNVSIAGADKVYLGYAPLSSSTLSTNVQSGVGPFEYHWSTGATTSAITVMPLVTTDYTVEVNDVQGCKTTAVFTVCVVDVRCGQNLDKVLMCKKEKNGKGTEICVAFSAVPAQLKTGAVLGGCVGKQGLIGDDGDIQDLEAKMVIYPNPSNGLVTINLTGLTAGKLQIFVKDLLGRTIRFEEVDNPSTQLIKNLTLESSGVYHLIVVTGDLSLTGRFTVIK